MGEFSPEFKAMAGELKREILAQVTDKTDPRYLALVAADPILSGKATGDDELAREERPATLA